MVVGAAGVVDTLLGPEGTRAASHRLVVGGVVSVRSTSHQTVSCAAVGPGGLARLFGGWVVGWVWGLVVV